MGICLVPLGRYPGGYYGKLWELKTVKDPGGTPTTLQQARHTWDPGGNLAQRTDVLASETETFTYDFLDRLTGVSGPYSHSYAYSPIGNITAMNGASYTYGSSKPHAVTAVGSKSYAYDANGNMTTRDNQSLTLDVENRPISITQGGQTIASFVYNGDGQRAKKTESSETIVYASKYYQKNTTTGVSTLFYYLGGRLLATKEGSTLRWVSQDHLTGTALMTDGSGNQVGSTKFYPFGSARSGSVPTDRKFTGQRLDTSGLYYYGARYYDADIGRFISSDNIVSQPANPQAFNRYSYVLNNPLRYVDPTGQMAGFSRISHPVEPEPPPPPPPPLSLLQRNAALAMISNIAQNTPQQQATSGPLDKASPKPKEESEGYSREPLEQALAYANPTAPIVNAFAGLLAQASGGIPERRQDVIVVHSVKEGPATLGFDILGTDTYTLGHHIFTKGYLAVDRSTYGHELGHVLEFDVLGVGIVPVSAVSYGYTFARIWLEGGGIHDYHPLELLAEWYRSMKRPE